MSTFIKTGFWEKAGSKAPLGWLNLDRLIAESRGGSTTVLTDAATVDISSAKASLTTSSATRTFEITTTADDITLEVILNNTAATYTFPTNSLGVAEGVASGNNTISLSGTSGDHYIIGIKYIGGTYYVVSKNFGQ